MRAGTPPVPRGAPRAPIGRTASGPGQPCGVFEEDRHGHTGVTAVVLWSLQRDGHDPYSTGMSALAWLLPR